MCYVRSIYAELNENAGECKFENMHLLANLHLLGSFLVLRMLRSPNDVKQKFQMTINSIYTTTQ